MQGERMGRGSHSDGFALTEAAAEAPAVHEREEPSLRDLPAWAWALLVLSLGLGITLWSVARQYEHARVAHEAALRDLVDRSEEALASRLAYCGLLLRSMQTVFSASHDVSPEEFEAAYATLRPREVMSSLQAVGYAQRELRADGEHYVNTMVVPGEGNQRVLGLDLGSQPGNMVAVRYSRDTALPALSAPFRLAQQEPDEAPDGLTMRLPVFAPGLPPATVEERRARIRGSLAISFRPSIMIANALRPVASRNAMHIVVSDEGGAVLFDSALGAHADDRRAAEYVRSVHFGGRAWRLAMQPLPSAAAPGWPWLTLLLGGAVSLSLGLLAWALASTQHHARELAWRMSRKARESEANFRTLNELLPALVLMVRREDHAIVYANESARDRLGEGIVRARLDDVFEEPLPLEELSEGARRSNLEAVLRSLNGDRFWANVSLSAVRVGERDKLLLVALDISEQRQLTELLSYQASHDPLTELYNRREFERRVDMALASVAAGGPPSALLYIDLDQFKLVNDISGHMAGDQLLAQLAMVMREQLRGGDILARLGGDEFGVLAMEASEEGVQLVAERLRARIDGYSFVWEDRTYFISASIGVVMLDDPAGSSRDVFAHADAACYMAKEAGRNRIHVYRAEDAATSRRVGEMEWASRLRNALDENRLVLYYQRIRRLDRALEGEHVELLVRLRDEQGGLVPPGAFLPAAERYGLMPLIDRWVIETTLANFARMDIGSGPPKLCAINLSGASIDDETLGDRILELLRFHNVDPSRICFEVTETLAVRNMAATVRLIERLREVGCRFALDDFGAGMSSFGYLKNLPVDIIKIDGSFIRDLLQDPMSEAIVRAIADIGHRRRLAVVAEWVQDEATAAALRVLGVDYAQGFALHVPERVRFT